MDFEQYGRFLLLVNGLSCRGSSSWVIADGMGFQDEAVWWPSTWSARPVPHEGLDLVQFKTDSGVEPIQPGFNVLTPVSGVVVEVCPDYLDETVWINPHSHPGRLVLLSHVHAQVVVGQRLVCGEPVGNVSYPVMNVPLHLHLSVLVGEWRSVKVLTWEEVHRQASLRFIYPTF